MNRIARLLPALCLALAISLPATAAALPDYLALQGMRLAGWLADGSLALVGGPPDAVQLYRLDGPQGTPQPLPCADTAQYAGFAHPWDASQLACLARPQQGLAPQLYLRTGTAAPRLLTDGHAWHGSVAWAHDGRRLALQGNGRDGRSQDVYIVDASQQDPAPRLIVGGDAATLRLQDWSPDDTKLLLLRHVEAGRDELLLVDIATGTVQTPGEVSGQRGRMAESIRQARFTADGRNVILLTDGGGQFHGLVRMALASGERTVLAPQHRSDIDLFALGRDGRYLAYALGEAGYSRLVLHDLQQKADLLLPSLPAGSVLTGMAFDASGRRLALTLQGARMPAAVHVLSIDADGLPQLAAWTGTDMGAVDASRLAGAESFAFPTWDQVGGRQRMIQAFMYRPQGEGPHPVLIDLRHGPQSQARPTWDAFTQYLVGELGHVVVTPDVRGASGHGRSFLALGTGALAGDAVRDVGSLLVWIGLQEGLDPDRVVVMGYTRGGDLALSSLANYGDRLAGAIVVDADAEGFTNTRSIRRPLLAGATGLHPAAARLQQLVQQLELAGVPARYIADGQQALLAEAAVFLERPR